MKLKLSLLLFCVYVYSFSQQKSNVDSTSYYLKESDKVYHQKKIPFLEKALVFANKSKNDSVIRKVNIALGIQGYYNKRYDCLIKANENLYQLYTKTKDTAVLAKHHHFKALYYRMENKIDSAFYFYHESKKLSLKIRDSLAVGRRLLSMARMQEEERDYLGSEITTIEGLKYLEPLNEYKYTGSLYNNLGMVMMETERFKEARKYLNKSKEINKQNPSKKRREIANLNYYINTALSYNKQGNFKEALFFIKKGLKRYHNIAFKYPHQYNLLQNGISYSYFNLGDYNKALKGYIKVLNSRKKEKDVFGLASSYELLSELYVTLQNKKKGVFYAKKGLYYAKKSKNNKRHLSLLKTLSSITLGHQLKQYTQSYIELSDSLYFRERMLKNQFAKIRYETNKKEKENTILKSENDKKQAQLESEKLQKTIGLISVLAVFSLLGVFFLAYRNRQKKILFKAQLEKAEVREKERQQIAKSLHDEVAGDLRILHQKLEKQQQMEAAKNLDLIKENIRNLSHQLSSISFDEVSFKNQIINLVSDYFSSSFKIKVLGINNLHWKIINNSIKRTLYLSSREAIQNSIKYANASVVTLTFESVKKEVHLNIQDNGKGFDTESVKKGIGLKNLKERVIELHGTVSIKSNLENGTNIKIIIPLNV